jgi:hypothetical protein
MYLFILKDICVLVSLTQLVWTMHKICKVWGSNLSHHQKQKGHTRTFLISTYCKYSCQKKKKGLLVNIKLSYENNYISSCHSVWFTEEGGEGF